MPLQTIVKTGRTLNETPNLDNYKKVCADFSWTKARNELNGLPDGKGLNIAFEAVDRHASGPLSKHVAIRWLGKSGETRDLYAMGTALERHQAQTDIALKAAGYGVPAAAVDGMDVNAVETATRAAIERLRAGDGPSCSSVALIVFAHTRCTTLSSTGAKRKWSSGKRNAR